MQSGAFTWLPEKQSVGNPWIRNNVTAAFIAAAIGFISIAAYALFGLGSADASAGIRVFRALVDAAAMAAIVAAYGRLSGAALAEKLPDLPLQTWTRLHVAIGVAIGLLMAVPGYFAGVPAAPMPTAAYSRPWSGEELQSAIAIGVLLGAMFGGMQTFVMRKVAAPLTLWFGFSVIAGFAFGAVFAVATAFRFVMLDNSSIVSGVAFEAVMFAATLVAAFVMMPAVNRLTPRVSRGRR